MTAEPVPAAPRALPPDVAHRLALLERVFDLLDRLEADDSDVISIQGLRHLVGQRPARRLPQGLCPVCGNPGTVLDGLMGLHSRSPHDSGWCRGFGKAPMQMIKES